VAPAPVDKNEFSSEYHDVRHPPELMPNHWHLVLRPERDAELSRLISWVGVTHARRHREIANQPLDEARLAGARHCVKRGCPHGDAPWVAQTAADLGLEQTLRPRGRPRKSASEEGK
jgi:putative transposase